MQDKRQLLHNFGQPGSTPLDNGISQDDTKQNTVKNAVKGKADEFHAPLSDLWV